MSRSRRGAHGARLVAVVVLCLFALRTVSLAGLATPSCAGQCPMDCPMHAKGMRCHEGRGSMRSAATHDCHGQRRHQGPSWRSAGCQHRTAVLQTAEPLIPGTDPALHLAAPLAFLRTGVPAPLRDPFLAPPFHPPPPAHAILG